MYLTLPYNLRVTIIFVLFCRKWLTNPVRKLSQSRLDKTGLDKSQNAPEGSSFASGVSPVKGASGSKQQQQQHAAAAERKAGHSKFYLKVSAPSWMLWLDAVQEDIGAVTSLTPQHGGVV